MTGWRALRMQVYRRDRGVCQACGMRVGRIWDAGHLVERALGGPDTLENLYLSCVHCNRTCKPEARTASEARAWIRNRRGGGTMEWRPVWEALRGMVGKE